MAGSTFKPLPPPPPPPKPPKPSATTTGLLPAISPITLLQTDASRTTNHIHTALPLLLFVARFAAIVRDPVPALTQLLVPLALAQGTYCILCLPPSTGSASTPAASSKKKPPKPTWTAKLVVRSSFHPLHHLQ